VNAILAALVPVGAVLALGAALRRAGLPGDGFWVPAERLTYYLLLPALIAGSLGGARFDALDPGYMPVAVASAVLVGAALAMGLRRVATLDGPAFTSLFQGSIRLNGYIGFAVALSLYGKSGLALAALTVGTYVPIVNVLCVTVLGRYAGEKAADWPTVARILARNPLILACLVGLALNLTGLGRIAAVAGLLDVLGRAALAIGLMCVGAGLSFTGFRRAGTSVALVCAIKLIAMPATVLIVGGALGVGGPAITVAVLFTGLPTATSAFILARQMGGDAVLMAQIVAVTHALAAATLPLVLTLAS